MKLNTVVIVIYDFIDRWLRHLNLFSMNFGLNQNRKKNNWRMRSAYCFGWFWFNKSRRKQKCFWLMNVLAVAQESANVITCQHQIENRFLFLFVSIFPNVKNIIFRYLLCRYRDFMNRQQLKNPFSIFFSLFKAFEFQKKFLCLFSILSIRTKSNESHFQRVLNNWNRISLKTEVYFRNWIHWNFAMNA